MKITKAQLKQIIKEEMEKVMATEDMSQYMSGAGSAGMGPPPKLKDFIKPDYRIHSSIPKVSVSRVLKASGMSPDAAKANPDDFGELLAKDPDVARVLDGKDIDVFLDVEGLLNYLF
tara:strand:- start:106 stop:456 length:351 start_codon:yes stop_codon:yes gene_type:complete